MRHARLAALVIPFALALAACSGSATQAPGGQPSAAPSAGTSAAPPAATGNTVSIAGFSFKAPAITVTVGTTVTWTNNDSTNHTVTADDGSFTSDPLAGGATFGQTFATAGTFAYHCTIHPTMTGSVTVQ